MFHDFFLILKNSSPWCLNGIHDQMWQKHIMFLPVLDTRKPLISWIFNNHRLLSIHIFEFSLHRYIFWIPNPLETHLIKLKLYSWWFFCLFFTVLRQISLTCICKTAVKILLDTWFYQWKTAIGFWYENNVDLGKSVIHAPFLYVFEVTCLQTDFSQHNCITTVFWLR